MWIVARTKQRTHYELWWKQENAQRVWIEITRRHEIGRDINHNTTTALKLLKIMKKGDKVIHWNSRLGYFVGVSTIKDTKPKKIDNGIGRLLSDFTEFPAGTLTLEHIRSQWKLVKEIRDAEFIQGQALYFPFAPYGSRKWKSLRPMFGYLAIAPPELVNLFGTIYKQQADPELSRTWKSYGVPTGKLPTLPKSSDESVKFKQVLVEQRQGQAEFRQALMVAYGYRCAVTGCDVRETLQAAHIVPVANRGQHHLQNGLLLRADIHNLFDRGLLTIDDRYFVQLHSSIRTSLIYKKFHDKKLAVLPSSKERKPSLKLLAQHRKFHLSN